MLVVLRKQFNKHKLMIEQSKELNSRSLLKPDSHPDHGCDISDPDGIRKNYLTNSKDHPSVHIALPPDKLANDIIGQVSPEVQRSYHRHIFLQERVEYFSASTINRIILIHLI